MRHDAAHALRVDDEPRDSAELHAVAAVLSDADDARASRRFGRPSPEATMALRHFERLVEGTAADDLDPAPARSQRFAHDERPRVARRRSGPAAPAKAEPDFDAVADALALAEPEPKPKPKPAPVNAPGRAYGSHRRHEGDAPRYVNGRRTVEITGQASLPRQRPSQTSAAFTARPDRVALWAFMLAMFLVVMALATAHGA